MRQLRFTRLGVLPAAVLLLTVTLVSAASAEPSSPQPAPWSDDSARTVKAGQKELSLLHSGAWGLSDDVELRLHPLLFLALPHAELKLRWLTAGAIQLTTAHSLVYPTPFLSLIAREGTGGLLPADSSPAHAVISRNRLLTSVELTQGHWLTVDLGADVAIGGAGSAPPLDFPFLYQRFATLYGPATPRASVLLQGSAFSHWSYELSAHAFWMWLEGQDDTTAREAYAALHWGVGAGHRLSAGVRAAWTHFTFGRRLHILPTVDYSHIW